MQTYLSFKDCTIETLEIMARQLQSSFETALECNSYQDSILGIKEQCKRLLCRAQEWKSKAFLIIVVGPVKSGKSTFVNLLAHEKVSPTHFLECTVRPSIISKKKDENADCLITPFITEGNPTMEHVDAIIDYIKGLEFADLGQIKQESPCLLTNENLNRKVSYRIGLEKIENDKVALTSITAQGGEFLQDNIFLIDMPGFDGVMANLDTSFYEAIVNRADLVVFVQSSNSAINKISEDFCEMIQKRNDSVPIYFVHNYFDSAYWHTEEDRGRVTEGHIKKALEFFEEHKFVVKSSDTFRINLGKVTDARDASFLGDPTKFLSEYKDVLLNEEERFVKLEHELHEKISSSQSKMRLQNCINRTIKEATILHKLLNERRTELYQLKQEYDGLDEAFKKLKSDIKTIEVNSVLNMTDKRSGLITQLQDIEQLFIKNISKKDSYTTENVRAKANDLINIYANSTKSYICGIFNPDNILKEISQGSHTNFIEAISQGLNKYKGLFESIYINDDIDIDYSSIYGIYDVNSCIRRKPLCFKYGGGEVVDLMSDIEHELFGLSPELAFGYIPQKFFTELKDKIEEWIDLVINKYRDGYITKIEEERIKALKEIIPDTECYEKEMRQIKNCIKDVEEIFDTFNN